MKQYDIEEYETITGKTPFGDWLLNLKDEMAQAKIRARIRRASFGNFGDWKDIKGAKGIFEMREHYSPGYRIFYAIVGKSLFCCWPDQLKKTRKKRLSKRKNI